MAAAPSGMTRFYYLLGALALAGGGTIAYLTLRPPPVSIPANVVVQITDTTGFHGYYLGSDSAPVTVTEYADYQCPACQQFMAVQMPSIEERLIRTGRVRWRYRDFPIDGAHLHARTVAHAAACADEQGRYWDMNRRIYDWEDNWPARQDVTGILRDYARALGLDTSKFNTCMGSARYAGRIEASKGEGARAGVGSTPTFLINNRLYPGGESVHYDMLKRLLDSLQAKPLR